MLNKIWELFADASFALFVPLVCAYYAFTSNVFLNVSCEEAKGLEKWGNVLLIPCHYLSVGQKAERDREERWIFSNRFDYHEYFGLKTAACVVVAIPGFIAGVCIKALSLLDPENLAKQRNLELAARTGWIQSNRELYASYGIDISPSERRLQPLGCQRRPGDEKNLSSEKEALRQIGQMFDAAKIPWWVDCGTCLGALRYGGAIPWDEDIDIAILKPDFDNAKRVLNQLDPSKYLVQDWSTRDHPKSFLKIYVRESKNFIDIYHFPILPQTRQIHYLLSFEKCYFWPEWLKVRERRFIAPISYDSVFPLIRASFDGVEVYVPRETSLYLQRYYGENLDPAKIFNPQTGHYEPDLSHPYWQRAFVH